MTEDAVGSLVPRAREVLEQHWTPWHHSVPNIDRYPAQYLWDSCFHSLIWAQLGDERAVMELASVFRHQDAGGFVPHVTYHSPAGLAGFWGRSSTSSITQPPMFGHAAAELVHRGYDVPDAVLDAATRGLRFLLGQRARIGDLVSLCHPWESGTDDSPRWDAWFGPAWEAGLWHRRKGELLTSIVRDANGAPLRNPAFAVASAGFNALVAFNALELAGLTGDERLVADAKQIIEALDARWDPRLETWVDASEGAAPSAAIRTADALLPLLVVDRPVPRSLLSSTGYGTVYGPSSVHVDEPTYVPGQYWRGSSWPQITYLLAVAAHRRGDIATRDGLRGLLAAGAARSGLAEHWHAETGEALGSSPQSWTGVAIVAIGR